MEDFEKSPETARPVARLSGWLKIFGIVSFLGSAALGGRLIWEQTVWTWELGPQMVGFSLAHGDGALLFVFPFLLILWIAVVAILTIRSLIKKNSIRAMRWVGLSFVVSLFVLMELPSGYWERLFASRMAASPRAGDLVMYAAAQGDLGTVKALISHGVRVDSTDRHTWRTGLHAAAHAGDLATVRYLVSMGANVNALDRSGDSPAELAAETQHEDVVMFLTEHGATRIRGDAAQHEKAIQDEVQEDSDELERSEAADRKLQELIKKSEQDEKQHSGNSESR
jgi:hypothetical protein